jgi:hypothetical protein
VVDNRAEESGVIDFIDDMLDLESLNNNNNNNNNNTSMCLSTPPSQSCSSNGNDRGYYQNNSPPSAPSRKSRVALEITTLVLDNLESLSAPLFDPDSPTTANFSFSSSSFYNPQTPLFNKCLQHMSQGDALQKLRDQRDAAASLAKEREQEEQQQEQQATARLCAMSVQDSKSEKDSPSSPKVKLVGRHAPRRVNSGMAPSA